MRLHEAALKFIDSQCGLHRWSEFGTLVRCKPREYYAEITARPDHSLQPYLKDQNGHAASAINGHLEGLFFSINTRRVETSPFGEIKFEIAAQELLNRLEHRIYFADFYCNCGKEESGGLQQRTASILPHYITLVVCRRNSKSDEFCREHGLLELDIKSPSCPFLRVRRETAGTRSVYSVAGLNPSVFGKSLPIAGLSTHHRPTTNPLHPFQWRSSTRSRWT